MVINVPLIYLNTGQARLVAYNRKLTRHFMLLKEIVCQFNNASFSFESGLLVYIKGCLRTR